MEHNRPEITLTSVLSIVAVVTVTLTLRADLAAGQGITHNGTEDGTGRDGTEDDLQKQIDDLAKARYLIFPHIYRAFIDAGKSPGHYNITSGCQSDLIRYYHGLNHNEGWAWRYQTGTV
nr:hypothetical protein BaRGS_017159 [Batillaria attramentaria]